MESNAAVLKLVDAALSTLIIGPPDKQRRIGKTTFAAALGSGRMVGARAYYDIKACDNVISAYNTGGWNFKRNENVKHLVYSTDKIKAVGMGYETQLSLDFDFNKFGLYSEDGREVMHVLPGSTLVVFEVQRKLDSRKSMHGDAFDDQLQAALEMQGHFGIRMIAEGHSWNRVEKRFREFADCVIEVQEQMHEYAPWDFNRDPKTSTPIRTTWKLHVFAGAGTYMQHLERKPGSDAPPLYEVMYYTFEGNIYKVIDSFSGRAHFVNGMQNGKNFDQKISEPPGHDKAAIVEYCKNNSFKRTTTKEDKAA